MISVDDVGFQYGASQEPALSNVSLRIEAGEVVGIVGPNGSGKSTLARLIKGLLSPTSGTVLVDGVDTRSDALGARRLVGLVFQNPNSQIVNAVVENEVAFGPENMGLPTDEIRRRVAESLAATGLAERATAECHALSMADKQRVAIASVMAMEPRYLILDEPTAWLEPAHRRTLLDRILQWCLARDVGLILVTHRMDEAQVCSRLYGMLDGRLAVTGAPREVLYDEGVRERLHLEVPEAMVLSAALRDAGLPVELGTSIETIAAALAVSEPST